MNVHHHQSPNAAFFALPVDPFQLIIVYYFLHLLMKSKKYALANPVYIDPVSQDMEEKKKNLLV